MIDNSMQTMATGSFDFVVVIPCFNDKNGLIRALKSIHYDPSKYAILIIDDGSTEPLDKSALLSFLHPGTTIAIRRLSGNRGITRALNAGINWLTCESAGAIDFKYIARLDCGDICDARRFEKQVNFLDQHPEIDLLGSWCVFQDDETGERLVYRTPTEDRQIKRAMYFRNVFIHPTVMWRKDIMTLNNYPENFPHAEDYGLFYGWIDKNIKTAVIPEILVTCRISHKGLSLANRKSQLKSRMKVIRFYGKNKILKALGIVKLFALLMLPYSMVFKMKQFLADWR
jgi:glycosyltransferase involved in cell wall biosynthesis